MSFCLCSETSVFVKWMCVCHKLCVVTRYDVRLTYVTAFVRFVKWNEEKKYIKNSEREGEEEWKDEIHIFRLWQQWIIWMNRIKTQDCRSRPFQMLKQRAEKRQWKMPWGENHKLTDTHSTTHNTRREKWQRNMSLSDFIESFLGTNSFGVGQTLHHNAYLANINRGSCQRVFYVLFSNLSRCHMWFSSPSPIIGQWTNSRTFSLPFHYDIIWWTELSSRAPRWINSYYS